MSKYALEVKNVSKSFRLPTEQASGIKQAFVNWTKGIKGYKEQHVLKDISFKVEKGDFFGIVGRNGSGKSTLLKIISQIYTPDSGEVKVNGTLIPFIELGVGFNPELTGRENVYLNGALLGFSHEEISVMYDDIVEFAELEEFMDQKLKNYSSGMQVRLAFSIAIKAQGDILVLDEVLAVGDEAFQRKCFDYFAELKKKKKTVILVTHSMEQVQRFCNKAILVDKGSDLTIGTPLDIANIYRRLNLPESTDTGENNVNNKLIKIESHFENKNDEKLCFDFNFIVNKEIKDYVITFVINHNDSAMVYRWTSDEEIEEKLTGNKKLSFEIENIFPNGKFSVQIGIKSRDRSKIYALYDNIVNFYLNNRGLSGNNIYWKPKTNFNIK